MKPLEAIKARCLDCCGHDRAEVKLCPCTDCPLYVYRLGKMPKNESRKRNLTDEQRDALRERLKKGREAKKQGTQDNDY